MITKIKNYTSLCLQNSQHIIFVLIGMCSFGYFVNGRSFAELHVSMLFLDFPIFIGEILLGLCLMLILIKNKNVRNIHIKWGALIFYISFILVKAFGGYGQWVPLAFRHSALFYYSLFLFAGYAAFNRSFFNDRINSVLVVLLLLALRFADPFRAHTFVVLMLMIILISTLSRKKLKIVLTLAAILLFDYQNILRVSRTELVGMGISSFFVVTFLLMAVKTKRLFKVALLVLYIIALVVFFSLLEQKANLASLFKFTEMKARYAQKMQIRDEKALTFKPFEYKTTRLYYDENKRKKEYDDSVEAWNLRLLLERELRESAEGEASVEREAGRIGNRVRRLSQMTLKERTESITENKDQMLSDTKINIVNRLDRLYHFDEELKEKAFNDDLESRMTLTARLNQIHNLNTIEERLSLAKILEERLGLTNEIERNILALGIIVVPYQRTVNHAINNSLFRLYIWEDALKDIIHDKPIVGFDFGKPFRSRNLEILGVAAGEWTRDGWIAIHNSYIDIVYRAGIVGIIYIFLLFITMIKLIKQFFNKAAMFGILLLGALIYWLIMANFVEILEMPYHAIPFWSLFGMTLAYSQQLKVREQSVLEK